MLKKRILLVDDEEGFTTVLKLNLESTGLYDVEVENHAERAVQTAMNYRPSLVLMDVIMPKKEGPDVAFEMKGNEVLQQTPIVFLTATVTREEVDSQGGVIGGHSFIAKPSTLDHLVNSIEKTLALV